MSNTEVAGPADMASTVLFVEDDDDVREFIRTMLAPAGFRVLTARDGTEALSLLAENDDVDALLTDIVMPGMSGIDLARTARQRQPKIKVLFMTGFYPNAADTAGLGRVMLKPMLAPNLIDELSELLASRPGGAEQG